MGTPGFGVMAAALAVWNVGVASIVGVAAYWLDKRRLLVDLIDGGSPPDHVQRTLGRGLPSRGFQRHLEIIQVLADGIHRVVLGSTITFYQFLSERR
jgi:hypothetical protein